MPVVHAIYINIQNKRGATHVRWRYARAVASSRVGQGGPWPAIQISGPSNNYHVIKAHVRFVWRQTPIPIGIQTVNVSLLTTEAVKRKKSFQNRFSNFNPYDGCRAENSACAPYKPYVYFTACVRPRPNDNARHTARQNRILSRTYCARRFVAKPRSPHTHYRRYAVGYPNDGLSRV